MSDQREALLPCPFCGKTDPVRIARSSEQEDFDDSNEDYFAVVCDASKDAGVGPGGCGASSGYQARLDQAVAAWNRRALAQPRAPISDAQIADDRITDIAIERCDFTVDDYGRVEYTFDCRRLLAFARDLLAAQGDAPSVSDIRNAGSELSNVAFNLAQKVGYTLTAHDCEVFDGARKKWDAAIAASTKER